MLKIAICDDTEAELMNIVTLTKEYLNAQTFSYEIRYFRHPDELLTVCEKETFHIYLLDMVMPMVDGLELGRTIRHASADAQIIYITTEPNYALDAYAVNPLHYLLKPIYKDTLFSAIDLAAKKVNFGDERLITVKTKNGLRSFSTDVIACCEYVRHTVWYTLIGGEKIETTTISGNFSEHIEPLMMDKRFIQPHTAFVVNMSCVERLSKDEFLLKNGVTVPVSGKQYTSVRNAYMSYRLEGVR